jgi:hypothetical protein
VCSCCCVWLCFRLYFCCVLSCAFICPPPPPPPLRVPCICRRRLCPPATAAKANTTVVSRQAPRGKRHFLAQRSTSVVLQVTFLAQRSTSVVLQRSTTVYITRSLSWKFDSRPIVPTTHVCLGTMLASGLKALLPPPRAGQLATRHPLGRHFLIKRRFV